MSNLFPMFVKLASRKCLVVGAGRVAESKIEGLLSCGAVVHVVAPKSTATITSWAHERRITWHERQFLASDLEGIFLVIAATACKAVNKAVFLEADARNILCNAVDEPARCHFYYPAVLRRGDLQIAISTAGLSPALAQRLRIDLESQFGPEYAVWLRKLGEGRRRVLARNMDPERRKRLLHRMAGRSMFGRFLARQKRRNGDTA